MDKFRIKWNSGGWDFGTFGLYTLLREKGCRIAGKFVVCNKTGEKVGRYYYN